MTFKRLNRPAALPLAILATATMLLAGCADDPQIRTYTTSKHSIVLAKNNVDGNDEDSVKPAGVKSRMLAALLPDDKQTWYFKVMDADELVAGKSEHFVSFLESLSFEEGKPQWELPEGWEQKPGDGIRFATIEIPTDGKPLSLTVTALPTPGTSYDDYVLANINRWRGQLQLKDITKSQLDEIETIESKAGKIRWVEIVGMSNPGGGMGRAPFAGGGARLPPGHPEPGTTVGPKPVGPPEAEAPTSLPKNLPFELEIPQGWKLAAGNQFSKAAFSVSAGGETASITISDLPGSAGALAPNINRWRGQVSLPAAGDAEMQKLIKPIQLDDTAGSYVVLEGSQKSILGVIAVRGGITWVVKLMGGSKLAADEKKNFEAFVASLKFKK
ncbi:MAG: hypothetical protein CMJ78_12195 [Planctomycetaceae bacterium]|nr:hypothetical protein [Planctomycetaceae bacterium]